MHYEKKLNQLKVKLRGQDFQNGQIVLRNLNSFVSELRHI